MNVSNRKKKFILVALTLSGLAGLIINNRYIQNEIDVYGIETIGKVTGVHSGLSSGPRADFIFYIDGEKIQGFDFLGDYGHPVKNGYFMVRYSSKDPEKAELLLDRPVGDTALIRAAGLPLPKPRRQL